MQDPLSLLPIKMADALEARELDSYMQLEYIYYENVIKPIESIDHYERCYEAIEPLAVRFGEFLRERLPREDEPRLDRICYLLPSLNNDRSHIELLHNILKCHPADGTPEVVVAGYTQDGNRIGSRLLYKLHQEARIRIRPVPFSAQGILEFARFFIRERFSLLVIFSVPILASAWVRALGADRVAWVTTKFELSSFPELRNRLSFSGPCAEVREVRGRTWRRSVAALSRSDIPTYASAGRPRNRLVSINRPEKMATPQFLEAVAGILEAEPSASFSWTGRERNPLLDAFFGDHGLSDRCRYIGWVEPSGVLGDYDIFLDTYGLSGMVATYAFCAGMPTVFFKDSQVWLEFHKDRIVTGTAGRLGREMLRATIAEDSGQYQASVLEIIRSADAYSARSAWQREIGEKYMLDEAMMYTSHFSNIRDILSRNKGIPEL